MKKVFNILLIVILLVIVIVESIFLVKGNSKEEKEVIPNTTEYSHLVQTVKVLYPDKTISFIVKRFYVFDEKDVCISSMSISYFYHEDDYLSRKNSSVDDNYEGEISNYHFDDENMIITHTTKPEYNVENNKELVMASLESTGEYIISSYEIY